jgi:hypothetical protein
MSEKKSLNFDFLDDNPKPATEEVSASAAGSQISTPFGKVNFLGYLNEYVSDFNAFCRKYLTSKRPPYILLLVWLFGVGSAADRLIGSIQDYSSWAEVWAIVLFGGVLSAAIGYYVSGWFYSVRLAWSKGKEDINISRNIYVFTSLPIALTSVLMLIFNQAAYGKDYLGYQHSDGSTIDVVFFFVYVAALVYSIRLSYRAATGVMHAERKRAIGWFVVAPTLLYAFLIFSNVLE